MQELVYLSDSKLRQFIPERRRGRIGQRLTAFRLTTPVGGLEFEAAGEASAGRQKHEHLASVVRHIEEQASWFQDPGVRAGKWVYFEAPCTILVPHVGTVMFIDSTPGAVAGYEQPHGSRLLLHGSSSHLLVGEAAPVSLLGNRALFVKGSVLAPIEVAVRRLSEVTPPTAEEPHGAVLEPPYSNSLLSMGVDHLLNAAQSLLPAWSAVWMRGYARVSAVTVPEGAITPPPRKSEPCVCATPLYVEYAHDLP